MRKRMREASDKQYQAYWEETQKEIAQEREQTAKTVSALEEKYSDRGLKFTRPFHGSVPVQAYGYLDGLRFYFRFRHNIGSIILGPYDEEFERRYAARVQEDHPERPERVQLPEDEQFYPSMVQFTARTEGPGQDFLLGWLTPQEEFEMFSTLADNLIEIKEAEWVDSFTQIWLDHKV